MKDAACTSKLSKEWQRTWFIFLIMNFHAMDFDAYCWERYYYSPETKQEIRMKRNKLMESIDKSLRCVLKKNLSVQQFNVVIAFCNYNYEWILPIDQSFAWQQNVMWERRILWWIFVHCGVTILNLYLTAYLGISWIPGI